MFTVIAFWQIFASMRWRGSVPSRRTVALRGNSWSWMDAYTRNLGIICITHRPSVTSYAEIQVRLLRDTVRAARRQGSVGEDKQ